MKYKTTQKDRYGNMRSLEIDTGENNLEVPPMTSMIPQYEAVGGLAENHPGEPKGSDTVPAWLTPGEFVVNKEATDLFGPQIKQMNDIGREIQDGNVSPSEANQIPMYARSGEEVNSMINQIMGSEKAKGGGNQFTHYEGDKPTKYGVTLETYREHINPKATIEDLKNLTEKSAKDIYKKYYYEKYKIDQLPDYMQHNVLDMAINAGPGRAIELLQKEINKTLPEGSKIDVDNSIGPQTLKAAKDYNNKENFDTSYGIARLNYYNKVVDNNPLKEKFLEGWQNRTNKFIEPREISLPEPRPNLDAVGNTTNLEVATSPVNPSAPEESGSGWSLFDVLRGRNNNNDLPEGVTTADVNESGVPHTEMVIPELPLSKPVIPRDEATAESAFMLDTGGLIPGIDYPSEYKDDEWWWGDSRTSSPVPVTNPGYKDYGELIPRYPIFDPSLEYADRHPGAGSALAVDSTLQNILEQNKPDLPVEYSNRHPGAGTNLPFGTIDDMPSEPKDDEWWWGDSRTSSPMPGSEPRGFEENIMGAIEETQDMLGPVEYSGKHPGAGPMSPDIPYIPVSDWNADPNKINPPALPPGEYSNRHPGAGSNLPFGVIDDMPSEYRPDTNWSPFTDSRTSSPTPGSEPRGWVDPLDVPIDRYPVDYDPQGIGEGGVLPFPDYRPDEQVGMEGIPTFTDKHEGAGPTTAEDVVPIDTSMWSMGQDTQWGSGIDQLKGRSSYLERKINEAVKNINLAAYKNNPKKTADLRKQITEWNKELKKVNRALAMKEAEKINVLADRPLYKDSKLMNEIVDLEKYIASGVMSEPELKVAEEKLAELQAKYKESRLYKITNDLNAGEEQLKEVVKNNHLDTKTEESIYKHWNSAKGQTDLKKIYEDGDSNPNWNKAKDVLKGTLGFLFGDIFDSKELGRAIAVYLGSRALGYKHGESISYVAKQYLKRVDAKNAAYDKWMLANANKYTKKSLSKFKKTRDPADLIPIGSIPRSQGEQSTWYDKNGKARMAYKFKIKDGLGDDHIYWSWDKNGKSEVEEGWHQDPKSVPGTTEFKAEAKKYRDDIEEQLKVLLDKYDIDKHRDPDKKIYANKYHTTITPAIDKDAVYNWAIKKKLQPEKIGSFLEQAMILATKEARGSTDKPNSILPYLDRVTIDEETKDFPRLMKSEDGEYELEDTEMVRLNQKITENFGAPTNFYNAAWQEWQKGKRKSDGESWPKVFKELAANEEANEAGWPPFALFVDNLLHEWMKENATKRGSANFVLDTVGKDQDLRS